MSPHRTTHFTLAILFIILSLVNCQSISVSTYYTNANCEGTVYATFYIDSSSCSGKGSCNSISLSGKQVYFISSCATEIPPSPTTTTDIYAYTYKDASTSCNGQPKSVQITPLNKCVIEYGTSYYVIYNDNGKNYFYDDKCTSKMMTTPLYLGQCLLGQVKSVISGRSNAGQLSGQVSVAVLTLVLSTLTFFLF